MRSIATYTTRLSADAKPQHLEKALVFTQFKETTAPLAAFLGSIFGRSGLVLHGETEVRKRKDLVRQFQNDESVPFFVLSVKAGGRKFKRGGVQPPVGIVPFSALFGGTTADRAVKFSE
jgi:hypothetical protein